MTPTRPSPDSLLLLAQETERQAERGKLKIYLGAAPGVGKTYTMLQDAWSKRKEGLDVVVGIVESHGREEIKSLLTHFEVLSRQHIDYRGKSLREFDLDAALKRQPGLILIDEMAHTNVFGVRHPKRWQDINEILNRGIDVYTTLNVQHIESLNDIVTQIIGVSIRETIPDTVLELADTIELVDLPPEDLLKRLQEGKVYFPAQAEIAKENFFRKGNLIALRELALRVTAEAVETQVLLYRHGEGVTRIWPTQGKILVCVGPGPEAARLIRTGRRLAASLHVHWMAVHVDTPRVKLSEAERNAAVRNLQLAERLGAETRILTGFDAVKSIMNFAREQNVTQVMVWKHIRSRWRNFLFKNFSDEVVRQSGDIDVYIVTGTVMPTKFVEKTPSPWSAYFLSLTIVGVCTVIDFVLSPYLANSNLIMVYLLGVSMVALSGRIGPSVLASVLSVLAYGFFFIPYENLMVSDAQYLITLTVMLIVSQVISHLTILARRQTAIAQTSERHIVALHNLSRLLVSLRGIDKLCEASARYMSAIFDSEVLVLLQKRHHLVCQAAYRSQKRLNAKEQAVAQWAYDLGQAAGLGTDTLPFSKALYVPLKGEMRTIGVLCIRPFDRDHLFTPEQMHLLEACALQIALAVEADQA